MKGTLISFLILYTINFIFAQSSDNPNQNCFKCHGMATLSKHVADAGIIKNLAVTPKGFGNSHHGDQTCFDCHSEEFATFPHTDEATEEELNCTDCHEGESETTGADFDRITEAFEASVHYKNTNGEFSCTDCHDAHKAFPKKEAADYISEVNRICFTCHIETSGKPGVALKEKHNSLSQKELDWTVRKCTDCHTDGTADAFKHKIVSKRDAKQ